MVAGTNSTPTGTPNLRCSEEGSFTQCKQFNRDTAWLWNNSVVLQLNCDPAGCGTAQLRGGPQTRQPLGEALLW